MKNQQPIIVRDKVKKTIFFLLGSIALGLGIAGIVLPLLPTTPFILVASACYIKSFDGLNHRLINSKIYKKYFTRMVEKKGMTIVTKLCILIPVLTMLLITALLVDYLLVRVIIGVLALAKIIAFSRIKTIKEPVKAPVIVSSGNDKPED